MKFPDNGIIHFMKRKRDKKEPDPIVDHGRQLILPEDLQVTRELGEGQYGIVQLGEWKPNGTNTIYVAIKSLKNTAFDGVLKGVLEEARTMQKLSHNNIVKMYGISLPFKDEPLKLVTEYAAYGSLEDNLVKKDKDVCQVSALSKFAVQVAEGMNYLAIQQLVHRDLSTRNILVFEPGLVKISDFGLARTLDEGAAKQITVHRKLAIAWMPPEAIEENMFIPASDVWSYGITLWEMFSFGEQPWADCQFLQIKQNIVSKSNKRLEKPHACPDGFYEIMLGCWEHEPKKRPTFQQIKNSVSQLQPKEGITKVSYKTTEQDHLSYDCKVKITVISSGEGGMLRGQSENGSIGLVHEKHLDYSKKKLNKHASGTISRPFSIMKKDSKEHMPKLQKSAASPSMMANKAVVEDGEREKVRQTKENGVVHNLLDLSEDNSARDPTNPLNPDRYAGNPAMDYEQLQAKYMSMAPAPGVVLEEDEENYTSMHHYQQPDAARNDGDYAILKDTERPENLIKRLDLQFAPPPRTPRTLSESEIDRWESDMDYAVPYQNKKGSRDDASLGRGAKGPPRGNTNPPDIPDRLDLNLQENKLITAGTAERDPFSSPYATTPRKKAPVPTPRRNAAQRHRPCSAGSLDTNTNSGEELRCNSESIANSDTQGVAHTTANKRVPPEPPLPYQSTKHAPDVQQELGENAHMLAEMHTEDQEGDDRQLPVEDQNQTLRTSEEPTKSKRHYIVLRTTIPNSERTVQPSTSQDSHRQEMLSNSQTPDAPPGKQIPGVTNDSDSFQLKEGPLYQNADVIKRFSADLIDLSSNHEENPADPDPIYDKPITLPLPPVIPPEVLNQPPPSPDKLFGGTMIMTRGVDTSHQHFVGDWPAEPVNPVIQPVNPVIQPVNPVVQPVNPASQPVNPVVQPVNPVVQPVNPVVEPVNPVVQPVNSGGATNGGAYGEEIDPAWIQEIRQICGEEVPHDWCYAALLQFGGDIEQAVRIIKIQKLSNLTGKTEQFCERTLSHCTWDLDRAAAYIFDNFEDEDV